MSKKVIFTDRSDSLLNSYLKEISKYDILSCSETNELIKKAQPELDRLEKKYANKDLNDQSVMMMKSQEMLAIYKKYNINPMSGCVFALIQIPLFFAFLRSICSCCSKILWLTTILSTSIPKSISLSKI